MNQQGQPIIFLPEGAQRLLGRDAQRNNIQVAKAVAGAVRTTLGPKGMDKMLVDELGDIIITNDGATILDEMNVEHPAAKMLVEVAKTQDDEVGDGTTSAVVLAGELLKQSEDLLDMGVHSSVIVKGYRLAAEKALSTLSTLSEDVTISDEDVLNKISVTAMTGKGPEKARFELSQLVVTAIKQVAEKEDGEYVIDTDHIKLEKKVGGDILDTELIQGIVVDKERVHTNMPKKVESAKIALVDSALEVKETETDAEIRITSPDQLEAYLEQEEKMLRTMVENIKESGANVVFCQKGIDDMAQHFLAKEGIFAARRVKKSDMEKLSKATGALIVSNLKDISSTDLGDADVVEERKIAGEAMTFVEGCSDPKAVTILVRGGTEHVVAEVERALNDAVGVVAASIEDGKIVSGGGSTEIELALSLRDYSKSIGGREQLAIEAFANALDIIPKTLAESAGMDSIDTLVDLRSKHEGSPDGKYFGVEVLKSQTANMFDLDVIEPLRVKKQAISSAAESAQMILRIDDVISGSGKGKGMPPEAMGGMGGMPPGMM
ncbi:MAG: TCP-1/cpn60 chaperonin family protein [Candidatus Diapherotrites archaeon]|nr:TCP-1/cpn60 chaperonin family protein [Candidatus Diapherotrites archaeon]